MQTNVVPPVPRPKYLTNKEILAEIHNSKKSYSSYERPEYANYDVIVPTLAHLTPEFVAEFRRNRAAKLASKNLPQPAEDADLIVRVMSTDHVPADTTGKRKSKIPGGIAATKTCFPPFVHYLWRDGEATEVGRSHWIGSLSNGYYSNEHGKISNRLARMFMLLVERYSRRGNWRGYCVDTDTEALTQRGWLRHDQITEQDVILSYSEGKLKWSSIKSIFRDNYDGDMFHLHGFGVDALVTPGHKFVTQDGLKRVEYLLPTDTMVVMGDIGLVRNTLASDVLLTFEKILTRRPKTLPIGEIDFHGGKRQGTLEDSNQPTVPYKGIVWCPETEYGCFIVRRNGCVYLTGNTYVDEMRSYALLQLSQVGLQFDESISDNPFAFYTRIMLNCFRRVLLLERKNQHIRDELLIMAGVAPSFSRQIDNEMEQREAPVTKEAPVEPPKKRGRKPKAASTSD